MKELSSVSEVIPPRAYVQHSIVLIQQEHPHMADEEMADQEQKRGKQVYDLGSQLPLRHENDVAIDYVARG